MDKRMTECNGSQQKTTLSPRQQAALALLLHGMSVTATAAEVRVNRSTVHKWMLESLFMSKFREGSERLRHELESRLTVLAAKSLDVVEAALDNGDTKAALDILKMTHRDRQEIDLNVHEKSDADLDAIIQNAIDDLRKPRETGCGHESGSVSHVQRQGDQNHSEGK